VPADHLGGTIASSLLHPGDAVSRCWNDDYTLHPAGTHLQRLTAEPPPR